MITKDKIKESIEMSDDFSISIRTANILKREKIETIQELISLTEDDIMNFKGSGQKTVIDLKNCLVELGLTLTPFPVKKLSFTELNTLKILVTNQLKKHQEVANA